MVVLKPEGCSFTSSNPKDALSTNGEEMTGAGVVVSMTTPQQLQIQKIGHWSCVGFEVVSECVLHVHPISSQTSAQGKTDAVNRNIENMNANFFMD